MTLAREQRPADSEHTERNPARSASPPTPTTLRPHVIVNTHARSNLAALQRLVGNGTVSALIAGPSAGAIAAPIADPTPALIAGPIPVQRLALQDGPPLAPGNYRYGDEIIGLDAKSMRRVLTDRAAKGGLVAERKWKADFVTDMQAMSGSPRKYEDPDRKQTVSVEPTLATNAEQGQREIDQSASAAQRQFQQDMLTMVRGMLDASEAKLKAEAKRYGFPDHDSIFKPKLASAGQAAVAGALPASEELRGAMRAAKVLVDGKQKLKSVQEANAKLGPILGDFTRPATLEPAAKEYHELRRKQLAEFPILAALERNDKSLRELASGAQFAQPGSVGHGATTAILNAQDKIRFELAEALSKITVVRDGMNAPDKIDKFWANPVLVGNTKRKMAIDPKSLPNAAVDDKIRQLQEDAEFSADLKKALGVGILILSVIPGAGLVAGGIGLVAGAIDVYGAFQDFYWEEAASGTAMDKAEAISQSDPSLFSLGAAIAFGLLEGVAEVKALEGAISVFKAVKTSYREVRAAAAIAEASSATAKTTATAELIAAREKLRTTVDQSSGKPGLGDQVLSSSQADAKALATDLKKSLGQIPEPALKELIINEGSVSVTENTTLADEAVIDAARLRREYAEWADLERNGPKGERGRRFVDWLREDRSGRPHGVVTDPAGLMEYGLDAGGAKRSFEACIRDDPTREAGVFRDVATGEHVCVQGGHSFVETGWTQLPENQLHGKARVWHLVTHYHPDRGLIIDRVPSKADFAVVTSNQRAGLGPPGPVKSTVAWTDTTSKIRFETEFGHVPGAPRPYWVRYRVEDGTMRVASFLDAPWDSGAAAYDAWIYSAFSNPAAAVPGGNVMPVAPSLPAVPGARPNVLPPPLPPNRK